MVLLMTRYVGAAELRKLFVVSRQRVDSLTRRTDFPEPAFELEQGRVWRYDDVKAWALARGRTFVDDEAPEEG